MDVKQIGNLIEKVEPSGGSQSRGSTEALTFHEVGEITPKSRPTFKVTNSIKPQVFISTPTERAMRQLIPLTRPATAQPNSFPRTATRTINAE
jgi:hypothetical protein